MAPEILNDTFEMRVILYELTKHNYLLYRTTKIFSGSFLPYLTGVINHSTATSSFTVELALAEAISDFKKDDPLDRPPDRLFLGEITVHNTA